MDLSRLSNILAPSDFAEPASVDHAAMYADGVVHLLASGGFEQMTMGSVARWMGQVPSASTQRSGGRDGFLLMVTRRLAGRWQRWVTRPSYDGALLRLPEGDDEVHGVRVWALVREVAAGEARAGRPLLAEIVARAEGQERAALAMELEERLGRRPRVGEVDLLHCFGLGVRAAMTGPVDPMSRRDAEDLRDWVTSLIGSQGVVRPE